MKRLLFFMLLLIAAFALGLAAWLLRAPAGQARLEALLRAHLPESVEIGGLSGRLPFAGRAAMIAVRDEEGVWLEAEGVEWHIARRALLRRELVVQHLEIQRLRVHREPRSREADGARDSKEGSRWPIWVRSAAIKEFHLSPALTGEPFSGRARADFKAERGGWSVEVSIATEWKGEPVQIVGSAVRTDNEALIHIPEVEADGIRISGMGMWRPRGDLRLTGSFSNAPLIARLTGLEARGSGEFDGGVTWGDGAARVEARVSVAGVAGYGASNGYAAASGTWRGGAGWAVNIETAGAEVAGIPVRLAAPARVAAVEGGIAWNAPRIEALGAVARSMGRVTSNEWSGELIADKIDLTATPISRRLRAGRAQAELRVAGFPADPVWTVGAEAVDLDISIDDAYQLKPARASVAAMVSGGVARARGEWSGWTQAPIEFDAALPLSMGGKGRKLGIDPNGPIGARLHFDIDLAEIGAFTDLGGSEVGGRLTGNVEVHGTWSQPAVAGQVVLTSGAVTFAKSGAILRDISIVLEGDAAQLAIRRADARDGSGGRVTADGSIRFDPAAGFPLHAALTLQRATVWRQNGNFARLDGRLALVGTLAAPSLTGELSVAEMEIRLRPTPPPIPRLPVAQALAEQPTAAVRTSFLHRIALDVGLGGRAIRVIGRGLDSNWRATLRAEGTLAAPRVRGVVSLERGYFLFMGRRFTLDRASLTLDGRWPPEPLLDVVAVARAGDMQAQLYAAGPLGAPALNLESEPAYPTEEILSRLLFGRSADAISPLQAVRLAHGLNILRGRGHTIDVLERGQSALRVDQLELVQSDQEIGISAISVGKYIGRNVYVEGEKSLGNSPDLITVEVELTPSLILTTETSPRIREGIGIKWRRDY
jgi:translocation and assembly module TamB